MYQWIFDGDFQVTEDMILNGAFIKEKIPNEVTGNFYCSDLGLTSLEGCPSKIGIDFFVSHNQLTSLEGSPSIIKGCFFCNDNLVDLKIEHRFIMSGAFSLRLNYDSSYWLDLLNYMLEKNIELNKVLGWPKEFLTPEIISSIKGINKFNL